MTNSILAQLFHELGFIVQHAIDSKQQLDRIEKGQNKLMATLADITAGLKTVADNQAAETKAFADFISKTKQPDGSISATDADGIVASLKDIADKQQAELTQIAPAPTEPPVTGAAPTA